MTVEELAHRGVALRDQRTVVEQCGGFGERRVVDRDGGAAHRFEARDGIGEGGFGGAVAEEHERRRDAEAEARRVRRLQQREFTAVGVERVEGRGGLQCLQRRGHRAREDRDAVDALCRRHHAARTQQAARGLQAHDVVKAGRHAAGTRGVGAERKIHLAGRHHVGRAGTRSPRHVARVESVGHRAVGRARAVQAAGELVEVGLADQRRTGIEQALHHLGVGVGRAREEGAARRGRHAGRVDVVLGGKAQPGQRAFGGTGDRLRQLGDPCRAGRVVDFLHHHQASCLVYKMSCKQCANESRCP